MTTETHTHRYEHTSHHAHSATEVAEHDHCQTDHACSCDHGEHCCCCEDSNCVSGDCDCHAAD